jgi:hypothetical protein
MVGPEVYVMGLRKPAAAILGLTFLFVSPAFAQNANDNSGGMGNGAAVGSNGTTELYGDRMWDATSAKRQDNANPNSDAAIGPNEATGGAPRR